MQDPGKSKPKSKSINKTVLCSIINVYIATIVVPVVSIVVAASPSVPVTSSIIVHWITVNVSAPIGIATS